MFVVAKLRKYFGTTKYIKEKISLSELILYIKMYDICIFLLTGFGLHAALNQKGCFPNCMQRYYIGETSMLLNDGRVWQTMANCGK